MISLFYNAGTRIVAQVALMLAGYYAEGQTKAFGCVHDELPQVLELLKQYKLLEENDFCNQAEMSAWLHRVADILDQLWD